MSAVSNDDSKVYKNTYLSPSNLPWTIDSTYSTTRIAIPSTMRHTLSIRIAIHRRHRPMTVSRSTIDPIHGPMSRNRRYRRYRRNRHATVRIKTHIFLRGFLSQPAMEPTLCPVRHDSSTVGSSVLATKSGQVRLGGDHWHNGWDGGDLCLCHLLLAHFVSVFFAQLAGWGARAGRSTVSRLATAEEAEGSFATQ